MAASEAGREGGILSPPTADTIVSEQRETGPLSMTIDGGGAWEAGMNYAWGEKGKVYI